MKHFDPEWRDSVKAKTDRLSPESKKKIQDIEAKDTDVKAALSRLAETPDGIHVLRWLHQELGFKTANVIFKQNGEAAHDTMLSMNSQRAVWTMIRNKLDVRHRNLIEEDQ